MNIEQRTVGDVIVLSIPGDIITTYGGEATRLADRVRSELQRGHERIVLDLRHVRYVDSSGLGELVQAQSAVRTRSGAIRLLHVSKQLKDLLEVTRLLPVFDCFDQEDKALASFDAHALSR